MERLPSEVLRRVCQWLDVRSLSNAVVVSHKFNDAINSDKIWKPLAMALMPKSSTAEDPQIPCEENVDCWCNHTAATVGSPSTYSPTFARARAAAATQLQRVFQNENIFDDGGEEIADNRFAYQCNDQTSRVFILPTPTAPDCVKFVGLLTPHAKRIIQIAAAGTSHSRPASVSLRTSFDDWLEPPTWKDCWSILQVIYTVSLSGPALLEAIALLARNPDDLIISKMSQLLNFGNFPILEAAGPILAYVRDRQVASALGCLNTFYSSFSQQYNDESLRTSGNKSGAPRSPSITMKRRQMESVLNETVLTLAALGSRAALVPIMQLCASDEVESSVAAFSMLNSLIASIGGNAAALDEIERRYNAPSSMTLPLHERLVHLASDASWVPSAVRGFCVHELIRARVVDRSAYQILASRDPVVVKAVESMILDSADAFYLIPTLRELMCDVHGDPDVRVSAAWLLHHLDAVDRRFFEEAKAIPSFPLKLPPNIVIPKHIRETILTHWTAQSDRVAPGSDRRWLLEGAWLLHQQRQQQQQQQRQQDSFQNAGRSPPIARPSAFGTYQLNMSNGSTITSFSRIFERARKDIVLAAAKRGINLERVVVDREQLSSSSPDPEDLESGGEQQEQPNWFDSSEVPLTFMVRCSLKAGDSSTPKTATAVVRLSSVGPFAELEFRAGDRAFQTAAARTANSLTNSNCRTNNNNHHLVHEPLPSVEETQLLLEQAIREIGFEIVNPVILNQVVPELLVFDSAQYASERTIGELLHLRQF